MKQIGDLKIYTLKEISESLNISVHTLRRYIRKGKLPGNRFAGFYYVSEESLKKFFNKLQE